MNCPFCHQEMYFDGYALGRFGEYKGYSCNSIPCLVNTEFPRYKCYLDQNNVLVNEEYALGDFYVKVSEEDSIISHLMSSVLQDPIVIRRQLFLNHINMDQTLDKLKMMVIFS